MRCPKCDTTNSDFGVSCLKCGYSFQQAATYEEFKPDYDVAPGQAPPPGQYGAPGGPSAYQTYDEPKARKTKKIGVALLVVGVIFLIIGIIIPFVIGTALDAKTPEELDEWAQTAETGDEIVVKGEMGSEEDFAGARIYQFKDSETSLTCGEDFCNEGDTVIVNIEYSSPGLYEIREEFDTTGGTAMWCYLPFLIIGIVFIIIGALLLNKSKKIRTGQVPSAPQYPPQYPSQQPPPAPAPAPAPYAPPPQAPPPQAPPPQAPPPQAPPPAAPPPAPAPAPAPQQAPPPAAHPPAAPPRAPAPAPGAPPQQAPYPPQAPPQAAPPQPRAPAPAPAPAPGAPPQQAPQQQRPQQRR